MDAIINLKKKLRQNLLKKRKELTKAEVVECSKKVFENFQRKFNEDNFCDMEVVAGYYAINNEIDVLPILNLLRRKRIKIALPKMVASELKFYEWHEGQSLVCNKFNIKEPIGEKEVYPDLLIIPLLGFDKHGNRLGYGSGYYDRALSNLPYVKKVGIGYSFQQVENIPSEAHDVKLDMVITDSQIINLMPN